MKIDMYLEVETNRILISTQLMGFRKSALTEIIMENISNIGSWIEFITSLDSQGVCDTDPFSDMKI